MALKSAAIEARPSTSAGLFLLASPALSALRLSRRLDRAQHLFARPAIDLETCGFLVGAERSARLHTGLAVDLVLVEPDARQPALHRLDVLGSQLLRGRPRRRERLRARHAVGEMADEQ